MISKIALEFKKEDLEKVFKILVEQDSSFEIIGKGIIILPRKIAKQLQIDFDCKEVEIISLFHLPREEANKIRKRHLNFFDPV